MAATSGQTFNIVAVIQQGRLQYEAILLVASFRAANPDFAGRIFLAEPQPGPRWSGDPRADDAAARDLLLSLGAEILPFQNTTFGEAYPHGNKIEALLALPDEPFLFLDTDTLVIGDFGSVAFDFDRPSASMRRTATWPQIELYGPGYTQIWGALYDRFGLDMASTLDLSQPDEYWQRYMYFNAGWFFHRSPRIFGQRYLDYARSIRDDRPAALVCQELNPWLDQVALPLVIHSLGGGRPGPELSGLDGDVTCHYRSLSLLYARESDAAVAMLETICARKEVKAALKRHQPVKKLVYQGHGAEARALFDRADLPRKEQVIRNTLKRQDLWFR